MQATNYSESKDEYQENVCHEQGKVLVFGRSQSQKEYYEPVRELFVLVDGDNVFELSQIEVK
jgi:hypothetical protein